MAGMSMVQELEQLRAGSKSWKAEIETLQRLAAEQKEKITAMEAEKTAIVAKHSDEIAKLNEALKVANETIQAEQGKSSALSDELKKAKDKMALVPIGDVSDGQKQIADGANAAEPSAKRDFLAEYDAIEDSAEKVKFYRAHSKEIDEQFEAKK